MRDYLKVCEEFGLEPKYFTDEFVEGKLKFENEQKEFMFKCLMSNLNVEEAAKPELSIEEMIKVVAKSNFNIEGDFFNGIAWRDAIKMMYLVGHGYSIEDLDKLMKENEYSFGHMILGAAEFCPSIDVFKLIEEGYDAVQITTICEMGSYNLDVLAYIDPSFDPNQIEQVADGLADGIDILEYCDSSIPRSEMEEIRNELSYCE